MMILGEESMGKKIFAVFICLSLGFGILYGCAKKENGLISNTQDESSIEESRIFKVIFLDYDGTKLSIQNVEKGKAAEEPEEPKRSGYHFIGWDKLFDSITSDLVIKAQYVQEGDPLISIEDIRTSAGTKDVDVIVSIKNNPGILGMTLEISYDENVMKLISASNGEAVNNILNLTSSKQLQNGSKFVWDGQEILPEDVKDGEILMLRFEISKDSVPGKYPVRFHYRKGDIVNTELNNLEIPIENGSIIIS